MQCVRDYVVDNFVYMRKNFEFDDTDSLLGRGIIDSMGVIELLTFIQNEFSITIEDDEITEENFGTLWLIARFVHRKRSQQVLAS
jgi:acyl carrier protein